MTKRFKVITAFILLPIFVVAVYIFFLWVTYIDDTVTSGSKYGFTIGSSKQQIYEDISAAKEDYPELKIYISYGPRAGDNATLSPTKENFERALISDYWELLLDGDGEYFNVIRLRVENNALTQIYRHRKYFELP
ncbi:MAG: hypothetical protein AB7K73_12750 [Gammaproteobacteria bacterium]